MNHQREGYCPYCERVVFAKDGLLLPHGKPNPGANPPVQPCDEGRYLPIGPRLVRDTED